MFGVYGIAVDYRHLTILADYMVRQFSCSIFRHELTRHCLCKTQTHEGGYKPFNRTGIASKSSPLLKASFETTGAFLSDATLHGDFDDLRSPSGSIVMGTPVKTGTGSFDIRTAVEAY